MRQLITLVLIIVVGVFWNVIAIANQKKNYYFGYMYVYEAKETYASINLGKVSHLVAGGYDEIYDAGDAVLIEGILSSETVEVLTRLIRTNQINVVYLNSPGGSLKSGFEIGKLFKAKNIIAVVNFDAECESACALAFLGASTRIVQADPGRFGFHRQYRIGDGAPIYGEKISDTNVISRYLHEIHVESITAEEVVGTTGLASFSDRALFERGITTISREMSKNYATETIQRTGTSAYENFRSYCIPYQQATLEKIEAARQTRDLQEILAYESCSLLEPAMREPMVGLAFKSRAANAREVANIVLNMKEMIDEMHGVEEFNKRLTDPSYDSYLAGRKALDEKIFGK